MDERDWQIYELMCKNPYVTSIEVSKKTGMPVPTAARRLKSLKKRVKITIEPPYDELGLPVEALVFLEADEVQESDGVAEIMKIGGNWTHLLRVRARDMKHLNELVEGLSRKSRNISTILLVDRVVKCLRK